MQLFIGHEEIRAAIPDYRETHGYLVELDSQERLTFTEVGPEAGHNLRAVARWHDASETIVARSGALHHDLEISEALVQLIATKLQTALAANDAALRQADAEFVKIFGGLGLPTDNAQIQALPDAVRALIFQGVGLYMTGQRDDALHLFSTAASVYRAAAN